MRSVTVLLAASLAWTAPAFAADTPATPPPAPGTPGDQARQGLDLLMKALEGWVRQMPLYAPPEVTPEGDIIIRRLDKNRPAPPGGQGAPDGPGHSTPGAATDL
ncbi:hypothetical protein [Azospirillum sp. sgz302134]